MPRPRANQQAVAVALQQYALMLESGLASVECLDILARQTSDPMIQHAFALVADEVCCDGQPLSAAMRRHPRVFSSTVILLVRAAEESSNLAERLRRAGEMLERNCRLAGKVKEALVSPLITTLACGLILFCVTKFVLPRFIGMYDSMNMGLPLISRVVFGIIHLVNHPLFIVALLGGLGSVFLYRPLLADALFEAALRWKVTRDLAGSLLAVHFVDVLGTTLRDGIPLTRALGLLSATAPFRLHAEQMELVGERLQIHGSLSEAVADVDYFPRVIPSMLLVGEESGNLDQTLLATRGLLEEHNDLTLSQIVALIEPVVIAVMGLTTGAICVAMFLPIYGLLNQFNG